MINKVYFCCCCGSERLYYYITISFSKYRKTFHGNFDRFLWIFYQQYQVWYSWKEYVISLDKLINYQVSSGQFMNYMNKRLYLCNELDETCLCNTPFFGFESWITTSDKSVEINRWVFLWFTISNEEFSGLNCKSRRSIFLGGSLLFGLLLLLLLFVCFVLGWWCCCGWFT